MKLQALGIDLGKTVFHLVGLFRLMRHQPFGPRPARLLHPGSHSRPGWGSCENQV